jgi:TldD protein
MTNVSLLPGDSTLEEMIGTTDNGILMSTNRSWSIDDKRLNFQFGTEIGWLIRNGKLGEMVKNPTYSGVTPQFWGNCDAIAGAEEWVLWGTPNCGKGQPQQIMHTGHGASPARFRNVSIGVGYGS